MCRQANSTILSTFLFLMLSSIVMAADDDRMLFDFGTPEAAEQWQTVNDGVMGGRSDGRCKISDEKTMEFFGTLSLENNGGFASVRSRPKKLGLKQGDALVARVRGDGREYTLNLYVPRPRIAFSYRSSFKTQTGEWIEVVAPLNEFVATSFGRVVANDPLNPSEVNAMGFLLGDKKAGPFKLEIAWIKVAQAEPEAERSGADQ
jgi:monofunctional biosynthetic peptidoglycan transglycosylase